jgi:hypothetical protein
VEGAAFVNRKGLPALAGRKAFYLQ